MVDRTHPVEKVRGEAGPGGDAELLLGRLIRDVVPRSDLVVATKAVLTPDGPRTRNASRRHLISALDASLARLGLDEVKVEQEESIGGAALTVGEYLSPRLFVSYGFGLFNPGQIVSLRYILTDRLSLEASQAPDDTRGAIEYRVER